MPSDRGRTLDAVALFLQQTDRAICGAIVGDIPFNEEADAQDLYHGGAGGVASP